MTKPVLYALFRHITGQAPHKARRWNSPPEPRGSEAPPEASPKSSPGWSSSFFGTYSSGSYSGSSSKNRSGARYPGIPRCGSSPWPRSSLNPAASCHCLQIRLRQLIEPVKIHLLHIFAVHPAKLRHIEHSRRFADIVVIKGPLPVPPE